MDGKADSAAGLSGSIDEYLIMDIKQTIKKALAEALVLAVLSVAAALLINGVSPHGLSLVRPPAAAPAETSADTTGETASSDAIVDVATAESLLENGGAVFVDARSRDNYRQGHIPGAVSLPAYGADDDGEDPFLMFMEQYPSDTAIVAYCSSVHCSDSHVLAEALVEAGYTAVYVFTGGMETWQEKGLALEQDDES